MSTRHDRSLPPVRLLWGVLTALALVVGLGGLAAPASAVVATTTTLESSAAHPHRGDTVTFTARVALQGGAPVSVGAVEFRLAADMFGIGDPSAVVLGPVAVAPDGSASVDVELTSTDLPFLAGADTVVVMAQYQPADADTATSVSGPLQLSDLDAVAAAPTTTVVTGPSVATVGQATSLAATVTPASAAGSVLFSVNGEPVGSPVLVSGGAASRSYTFTTVGTATVTAAFTPFVPTAYAVSFDDTGRTVTVSAPAPTATTTTYTGPTTAVTGTGTTLTASVAPAAPGSMRFSTGDVVLGTVAVAAGTAKLPYTFSTAGITPVTATFVPTGAEYAASESTGTVVVSAPTSQPTPNVGGSATATGAAVGQGTATLSGCTPGGAARVAARAVNRVELRVRIRAQILAKIARFSNSGTATGSTGRSCSTSRAAADHSSRRTTVSVPCTASGDGLVCDLGSVPAGTAFSITVRYPLPAEAAGQKLQTTATAASVDEGTETVLDTEQATIAVPKRTVLSVSLAPVKKLTAVKRGSATAYRVVVKNAGVITAGGVKACVTLGAGASVRAAKGATVHGRTVCWMLPTLKKGKSATRTFTLVAPRKKGGLKVTLAVTPKKSEASPLRLSAVLPVR